MSSSKNTVGQCTAGKKIKLIWILRVFPVFLYILVSGEIIGESEAERRNEDDRLRGRDNFIYWIHENFGDESSVLTIVDPTSIGNIGRYLNHACDPILEAIPVRVESLVPRIGMFTRRDVLAGQGTIL